MEQFEVKNLVAVNGTKSFLLINTSEYDGGTSADGANGLVSVCYGLDELSELGSSKRDIEMADALSVGESFVGEDYDGVIIMRIV